MYKLVRSVYALVHLRALRCVMLTWHDADALRDVTCITCLHVCALRCHYVVFFARFFWSYIKDTPVHL